MTTRLIFDVHMVICFVAGVAAGQENSGWLLLGYLCGAFPHVVSRMLGEAST